HRATAVPGHRPVPGRGSRAIPLFSDNGRRGGRPDARRVRRRGTTTVLKHSTLVSVKQVPGKGRGVFARRAIRKGTVIEKVPVVLIPLEQFIDDPKSSLPSNFCFMRTRTTMALALG